MIVISYPLTSKSPLYPGTPPVTITPVKDIRDGDSSTTSLIAFSSHAGTHLDLPPHVCLNGGDLPMTFEGIHNAGRCICFRIPKSGDEPILPSDIGERGENFQDVQVVLLRTGSFAIRKTDPDLYSVHHPWLHPDCVPLLRKMFPTIRVIGLDVISITNPKFREEGREAHRRLLCGDPPVLILEDLDLSSEELLSGLFSLTIVPYVMGCNDGMPVFCYAEALR